MLDPARRGREPGALDAAREAHPGFGAWAACPRLDVECQEELAFKNDAFTIEHTAVTRCEQHARRPRGAPPREAVRKSGEQRVAHDRLFVDAFDPCVGRRRSVCPVFEDMPRRLLDFCRGPPDRGRSRTEAIRARDDVGRSGRERTPRYEPLGEHRARRGGKGRARGGDEHPPQARRDRKAAQQLAQG